MQTGKNPVFFVFRGNFYIFKHLYNKGWIEEVCELKSNAERMNLVFARAKR